MAELGLLLLAAAAAAWTILTFQRQQLRDVATPERSQIILKLWRYTDQAMAKQRWTLAEKALLRILKHDHKNTSAYNRLGMLYARTGQQPDAIACFDIASSLTPSIASLYNLSLVHFQSGNYAQAALAMEKVIDLEPTPKRLLVFARIQQRLGNHKRVVEAVKRVCELDSNPRNLEYLAESYEAARQYGQAEETRHQASAAKNQAVRESKKS